MDDAKTTPMGDSGVPTLPDAPLPVEPGELFLGKYRIERMLGRGGMGVVMAAHHEALDERVAIKFLGASGVGQKQALARFEREARAAAKIKNEHVAKVLDVGVFGEGSAYMVVEYLAGHDLGVEIDDKGELPVTDAVDYVLQALDAIADAHALGIVHRDLKPSNLFLTRRSNGSPLIKVLDFGIAKSEALAGGTGSNSDSLTATNSIMGSPRYMSPEQIRSTKTADHRSDIWSLGVILYELLTGGGPFEGETSTELFAAVLMDAPKPPRSRRPDLPERLEAVVLRCLTRDREQRYQSVAALAADLAEFAPPRSRGIVERFASEENAPATAKTVLAEAEGPPTKPSPSPKNLTPSAVAQTDTSWAPLEPTGKKSTFTTGAIAVLALLVLGLLGWLFWLRPRLEAEARLQAEEPGRDVSSAGASVAAPVASPAPVAVPAAEPPRVEPMPSATATALALPAPRKPRTEARPAAPAPSAAPAKKPRGSILEARE